MLIIILKKLPVTMQDTFLKLLLKLSLKMIRWGLKRLLQNFRLLI